MAVTTGSDLKIGDTVWHFDASREPPQCKQRVRAISLLDPETHADRNVATLPWSVVRSHPLDVKVELDPGPTWAGGSQVFPCAEPVGRSGRAADGNTTAVVAGVAGGVLAVIAVGFVVLFSYGVVAFIAAQAFAGLAVALFAKVVLPWLRGRWAAQATDRNTGAEPDPGSRG